MYCIVVDVHFGVKHDDDDEIEKLEDDGNVKVLNKRSFTHFDTVFGSKTMR